MNSRQNCSPYIGLHREWWKWRTIWVKPHLWYLPQENHTVKGFWTVSGRYQVRYPWYCLCCKQCKASPSWDKLFSQTPQHHRHVFTSSPSSRFLNPPFTKKMAAKYDIGYSPPYIFGYLAIYKGESKTLQTALVCNQKANSNILGEFWDRAHGLVLFIPPDVWNRFLSCKLNF